MGARYVSTGTDLAFLMSACTARAKQVQEIKILMTGTQASQAAREPCVAARCWRGHSGAAGAAHGGART